MFKFTITVSKINFFIKYQGAAYNFLNDLDNATICFKKIIKIDPNFADAYYNLGIIYKKLNKIELSILNYEICLKIKKTNMKPTII